MMDKTILLVEDNENDVLFMTLAFEQTGVTNPVQVVKDGREALAYLRGAGKYADRATYPLPYLVLLDLKLPRIMGLEVLKWIREQPQFDPTVVLVLTTSANASDVEAAYRLKANAYLVKPSGLDTLQLLAKSIKEFWLVHNRPASPFSDPRPPSLGEDSRNRSW